VGEEGEGVEEAEGGAAAAQTKRKMEKRVGKNQVDEKEPKAMKLKRGEEKEEEEEEEDPRAGVLRERITERLDAYEEVRYICVCEYIHYISIHYIFVVFVKLTRKTKVGGGGGGGGGGRGGGGGGGQSNNNFNKGLSGGVFDDSGRQGVQRTRTRTNIDLVVVAKRSVCVVLARKF